MFNPFVRFLPELTDAFRKCGERYIVSQTFRPAVELHTGDKDILMFCQYSDKSFAQIHLNAVKADRFAAIIDLENEKHLAKVKEMLEPESRYLIFSNLIRDKRAIEEIADKKYAHKLRKYIEDNTTWRISVNACLRPKLQLIFGELYIILKFQRQELKIKFEEIENF